MNPLRRLTAVLLGLLLLPLIAQGSELLKEVMNTFKGGDVSSAIARLETEIRTGQEHGRPPDPEFLAVLGFLYVEAKQPENAYRILQPLSESISDPGVLYNAGRAAFALGKEGEGEAFFARSAALSPVSPAARSLAFRRGQRGELLEGYRLLRPWALHYPGDQKARVFAAYLALELERPAEAEQLLSDLPQDEPRVRILWGELLLQRDDSHAAITMLSPLLNSAEHALPRELQRDLGRILAEAYLRTNRPAEALARVRELEPVDRTDALLLSRVYLASGNATSAVSVIRPFAEPLFAYATWPAEDRDRFTRIAMGYGHALIAAGEISKAREILRASLKRDPANLEGWELLHRLLQQAKETKRAEAVSEIIARLRKSEAATKGGRLKVSSDDTTGEKLREAQNWILRGDPERALVLIRREIALSPTDLRPRFLEFQTLLMMKRFAEANEAADRALELAPRNADAVYQKAVVLMSRHSMEEAEKTFRHVLQLAPDHTAALNDLAMLLLARNRIDEARELLERVLILQPDDARARAKLEELKRQ